MTLIFVEGSDDNLGSKGKWNLAYGTDASVVAGRNGNCLRLASTANSTVKRGFSATEEHATLIFGAAFRCPDSLVALELSASARGHVNFMSDMGATQHLSIVMAGGSANVSPRIEVYRGPNSTLLGSGAVPTWVLNQWYYLEVKAVLDDAAGSVEVKLNGTTYVNLTGVDTKNGGTKTVFDAFQLALANLTSGWAMHWDDIYVNNGAGATNNGFLGDVAVETLFPTGNGSSSQFVGSDGNSVDNYLLVDENPPATTDYVQSGTVGNKDLYAYGNLVRTSGTIYGVQVASYAQASDNDPVSIKHDAKSGATTGSSAALPLVTTYEPKLSVFETDPDTAAAWTIAGVNAAEIGMEVA